MHTSEVYTLKKCKVCLNIVVNPSLNLVFSVIVIFLSCSASLPEAGAVTLFYMFFMLCELQVAAGN